LSVSIAYNARRITEVSPHLSNHYTTQLPAAFPVIRQLYEDFLLRRMYVNTRIYDVPKVADFSNICKRVGIKFYTSKFYPPSFVRISNQFSCFYTLPPHKHTKQPNTLYHLPTKISPQPEFFQSNCGGLKLPHQPSWRFGVFCFLVFCFLYHTPTKNLHNRLFPTN